MAIQTALDSISNSSGSPFGFKNRIINGGMVIDQRNAGASLTTNGAYTLDRWYFETSNTDNNSVQQSTDAPTGFYNSLKVTTNTGGSVASGSYLDLVQKIEGFNCSDFGYGSASASKVTVSFWVKSSVTGTYSVSLRMPLAGTPVGSVQTYTINAANTWEQKSVTFTGNTATALPGTNTNQLAMYFYLASGSTYQTASTDTWVTTATGFVSSSSQSTGMLTTTGATFYITGVQLEKGSTATSFDYRPYGTELQLCQRYYYRITISSGNFTGIGRAFSTTQAIAPTIFPCTMRAAPTALEQNGTAGDYGVGYGAGQATGCNSVPTFNSATVEGAYTVFTIASGLTAGGAVNAYRAANSPYLGWSAEL